MSVIPARPFSPLSVYCGDALLSDFVYSKTMVTSRFTVSMDFSEDGRILYTGLIIDRAMQCFTNFNGTPWELDDFIYHGNNWPDWPNGNQGRQNCAGIHCGPGTPPTFMIASHDSTVNGKWVKWGMPIVDRNGDPLDSSLYGTFDGINSSTNVGGMTILQEVGNASPTSPIQTYNRIVGFRISTDGTVMFSRSNAGGSVILQEDFGTAWDLTALTLVDRSEGSTYGNANNIWVDEAGINIYTASGQTAYQLCTSDPWVCSSTTIPQPPTLVDSVDISTLLPEPEATAMGNISNIMLSPDKTRMYIVEYVGTSNANIHQFNR